MTDIKVGDRVVGYGHLSGDKYIGTVKEWSAEAGKWRLATDRRASVGKASDPFVVGVTPIEQETPEPTRDLIGKAPDVEGPKIVGPFHADGANIVDEKGTPFAGVRSFHDDYEPGEDAKIAEVIAKALNAYFGIEVK